MCCSPRSLGFRSEADDVAQKFIEKTYVKCGDSYIGKAPWLTGVNFGEIKGISVSTRQDNLADADKLNGIQWKGVIRIDCKAMRTYNGVYGWSQWSDNCVQQFAPLPYVTLPLTKQNNQWTLMPVGPMESYKPAKIDCNKLPAPK